MGENYKWEPGNRRIWQNPDTVFLLTRFHCHPLTFGALAGEGVEEDVEPDETVEFEVDHSSEGRFRVPGHLVVDSASADFEWSVTEAC